MKNLTKYLLLLLIFLGALLLSPAFLAQKVAAQETKCTVSCDWTKYVGTEALEQGPPYTVKLQSVSNDWTVTTFSTLITSNTKHTFTNLSPGVTQYQCHIIGDSRDMKAHGGVALRGGSPSCTTPTPTPTPTYTCTTSGGQCIPIAPCNPGYSYFGTGGTLCPTNSSVCCMSIPASTQTSTKNCGDQNCSSNQTCIGTSYDSSTFCLTKNAGGIGSYCGNPSKSPNNEACSSGKCDSTLRCVSKLVWQQIAVCPVPTSASTPALQRQCTQVNSGCGGGIPPCCAGLICDSTTFQCVSPTPTTGPTPQSQLPLAGCDKSPTFQYKDRSYATGAEICLNGTFNENKLNCNDSAKLLGGREKGQCVGALCYYCGATIITPTLAPAPPVSSTVNSIPKSAPSSFINYKNYDLNKDGVINCKDTEILISKYKQERANLSADFNHDGIVDGIDYNTLVRNYTPGDKTQCSRE